MSDSEKPWLTQVRTILDQSADGLDAATLSRLNRARQAALARRATAQRWYLPAGLASACVLLLALFTWHAPAPQTELPLAAKSAAGGDIDLVSSDDSLDFYQDLEFYAWLEAQDQDLGS